MTIPANLPRYRVWDGHRIHEVTKLQWSAAGLLWEAETGKGWVSLDMAYWLHAENGRPRVRPKVDVLLAATGMQDASGREIWEGDLVVGTIQAGLEEPEEHSCIVARWNEDRLRWEAWDPFNSQAYELSDYAPLDRVIGNVYENPGIIGEPEEGRE